MLAVLTGGAAWAYYQSNNIPYSDIPKASNEKREDEKKKVASDQARVTELPTVTVPETVDPSSVKPYTTVTENETYKIRELNGDYVITLYAIINRPDQSDEYRDQLRRYKQDALNYLKEHSVDVTKVNIAYEPEEASQL